MWEGICLEIKVEFSEIVSNYWNYRNSSQLKERKFSVKRVDCTMNIDD